MNDGIGNLGGRFARVAFFGLTLCVLIASLGSHMATAEATTTATTLMVDLKTGSDTASCGTVTQPCASIQYALDNAASGTTIRVAAGTYTFQAAYDRCSDIINTTAVVCILDKEITILGGFTASDWSTARPDTNVTIIDGKNSKRGVLIQHHDGQSPASLTMEGFTIQNSLVQGEDSGLDSATFAFGGGMRADRSTVFLKKMIFRNNRVVGGNTNNDYGGAAAGGGIAIRAGAGTSVLEDVRFENNQALGGNGTNRGGFAIGGGLYTFIASVRGSQLTFTGNLTQGGSSTGTGVGADGENADGQGGGAAFHQDSKVVLERITVVGNRTLGGNAPNGQGGGAFGGGLFTETASTLEVNDALIRDNHAIGGNGKNAAPHGSVALGGGITTDNSWLTLRRATVLANQAIGGNGTITRGSGGGGGIALVRVYGDSRAYISNSVIANNITRMGTGEVISGGGGGGLYMRGAAASIDHSTIAQNEIGPSAMQGSGIALLSSGFSAAATLSYSIVAQHTVPSTAYALHAQPGNTIRLEAGLTDGNSANYGGGGTIEGMDNMAAAPARFRSPGAPNYDYHIEETSAARDAAARSAAKDDFDSDIRDSQPDIGADEYVPPRITGIYAASTSNSTVRITWDTEGNGIERYEVIIFCPRGASRPNEVACETAWDVGSQQEVLFTGLTNGVEYVIEVWAFSTEDREVDIRSTAFRVADSFLFLPFAVAD